jgi:uncharacterized membrane protein YfcA
LPRLVSLLLLVAYAVPAHAADGQALPWWFWVLALFVVSFAIGVVAVIAGVGGGVLFVPLVSSFFPFHLDFVRGAGLLVALAAALSAAPTLLRTGIASLRLALPLALIGSVTSILGALLGFAVPVRALELALGVLILIIVVLMAATKSADHPHVARMDALAAALGLRGQYEDRGLKREIEWMTHHTPAGLAAFAVIGLIGGLFGLGAGWANVPALNLLMGAPIKLAVGTSGLAISIINTSAAWIFLNRGAVLPIIVVPSIIGVILGARIGAKLLTVTPGAVIRRLVIVMLALAGTRALLKGLGLWG